MRKRYVQLFIVVVALLLLAACGGATTPTDTGQTATEEPAAAEPTAEEAAPEASPTEEEMEEGEATPTEEMEEAEATPTEADEEEAEATPTEADEEEAEATPTEAEGEEGTGSTAGGDVVFFSTQFVPVEEQEAFRAILAEGGYDFTGSEEGPLLDVVLAGEETGSGEIDVVGSLHGTFPPLAEEGALVNMIDIAEDLMADREFAEAYLETGLLGSDDYLYYVPWMQATYIMAARNEALEFLPEGAELESLTWEQLGQWCQTLAEETGEPKCGMPHAGLFHRFLQGYLWPSFTGGMVTQFKSEEAVSMLEWARDSFWPYVSPQSISYEFMQEPLLANEVWVAFDHTARLLEAFNTEPENFVAFPAPAGPAGRGFMPVVVGLGIPSSAPNPEGAAELIDFLTTPETQARVLQDLGFLPVVTGVDDSDLPEGVAIELEAVETQTNASDALPALLPIGLGERGGEINQMYRNAFDRVVIDGEDVQTVLDEEAATLQALLDETGAACWAPDPPSEGPCQIE